MALNNFCSVGPDLIRRARGIYFYDYLFVFCLLNYITLRISDCYNCSESICWVPLLKYVNICWACVSSVRWVATGPPVLPQAGSGKPRRQGTGIGAKQGAAAPRRFSTRRRKHNHRLVRTAQDWLRAAPHASARPGRAGKCPFLTNSKD